MHGTDMREYKKTKTIMRQETVDRKSSGRLNKPIMSMANGPLKYCSDICKVLGTLRVCIRY